MKGFCVNLALVATLVVSAPLRADAIGELLSGYEAEGAGPFDAGAGAALWAHPHTATHGSERACTSCHTADPRRSGRHAVTGKAIEPMAPSVNPGRLTDARTIAKWLLRNCKWTLGRACTAQEKGDLIRYLASR